MEIDRNTTARTLTAEKLASPFFKSISGRYLVDNLQGWRISLYVGSISFKVKALQDLILHIVLYDYREDNTIHKYIIRLTNTGIVLGEDCVVFKTDNIPLLPYEGLHGKALRYLFGYYITLNDEVYFSRYAYKFATQEEFYSGTFKPDDFAQIKLRHKPFDIITTTISTEVAYQTLNSSDYRLDVKAFFTRGNVNLHSHPVHEIHRQIDKVIEAKKSDKKGHHYIRFAFYDMDSEHIANHLIYAKQKGIDVQCISDWYSSSSMNCSDYVARLRRANIPILSVVRNNPLNKSDLSSMHTKIISFDGNTLQTASYNLHFHLWGGNLENALFYYDRLSTSLYEQIYRSILTGYFKKLTVNLKARYNFFYSLGSYCDDEDRDLAVHDVIVTLLTEARHSIDVCMFDIAYLTGKVIGTDIVTDVISCLCRAKERGLRVRVILNGMIAHTGKLPPAWDKDYYRPLKEPAQRLVHCGIEIYFVYYHESIYSPVHHKFAVIDEETVITESYNWYEPSKTSDETLAVLRDRDLAVSFLEEMQWIIQNYRVKPY